jgi:hypothetical protein
MVVLMVLVVVFVVMPWRLLLSRLIPLLGPDLYWSSVLL